MPKAKKPPALEKTLRDELAIGALPLMQFALDLRYVEDEYGVTTIAALVQAAYKIADAMLAARK